MTPDRSPLSSAVDRLAEGLACGQRDISDDQIRDGLIAFPDLIRLGNEQGLLHGEWKVWRHCRDSRGIARLQRRQSARGGRGHPRLFGQGAGAALPPANAGENAMTVPVGMRPENMAISQALFAAQLPWRVDVVHWDDLTGAFRNITSDTAVPFEVQRGVV